MSNQTEHALAIIGILSVVVFFYRVVHCVTPFLRRSSLSRYNKTQSSWAIVTGATSGIGLAFAEEMAAAGFNVILHGRNCSKLSAIQKTLSATYPDADFRLLVNDAQDVDITGITRFAASIQDLNLRVLVNNVGGSSHMRADFTTLEEHTTAEINDTIALNMIFTTHLTHSLMPLLSRHQPSLILNTGSGACAGLPYIAVYSGAKAYLSTWGKALSIEMQAEGLDIEVMTVLTGSTQSGQDSRTVTLMRPSSRTMARAALARIGCGRSVVVPYWAHALQSGLMSILPEGLAKVVLIKSFKRMKGKTLDGTERIKQS